MAPKCAICLVNRVVGLPQKIYRKIFRTSEPPSQEMHTEKCDPKALHVVHNHTISRRNTRKLLRQTSKKIFKAEQLLESLHQQIRQAKDLHSEMVNEIKNLYNFDEYSADETEDEHEDEDTQVFSNETALNIVSDATEKICFDLFKILSEVEGNLFFSPASIQVILALVHLGAKGKTAQEIAESLSLPSDKKTIEDGFRELMNQLKGTDDTVLEAANKVYAQTSFPIKEEFRASAAKFLAEAEEVDFIKETEKSRAKINEWVENKTNKKIKDLLPAGTLDAMTRLVLVNAIYFKGLWNFPFEKKVTAPMPFHVTATEKKTVDMMNLKKKFMYTEDDQLEAQVLELRYKGDQLSMVIILPKKNDGLKELEAKLAGMNLPDILNKMRKAEVNVYLPKFKLEHSLDLNECLQKMGMKTMFDEGKADFTGINDSKPGLVVSKVVHKAFIEVNEEGTEAAAATGAVMCLRMAPIPQEPKTFKADHPYLFFIIDCQTKTSIFAGHLCSPNCN